MTPQMSKSIHSGQVPLRDKVGILGSKNCQKMMKKLLIWNRSRIIPSWSMDLQDIYDRPKNHENNDENDEKMNDFKSTQDHFEDVPVSPGHQKNIKNNQFRSPDTPEKNQKNHPKTHQFDGVWDPNFSNFPCWRMCCLRRPLGRYFK